MTSKVIHIQSTNYKRDVNIEFGIEERLFRSLDTANKGYIVKKQFIEGIGNSGLNVHHANLHSTFSKLGHLSDNTRINFEKFIELTTGNLTLIEKALTGGFIIPDFQNFSSIIDDIYAQVRFMKEGEVANYIPQLGRINPDLFAISLCTIDGQIHSIGDWKTHFSVQSTCKPINYCLAQRLHGEDIVHQFIGKEPSGHRFNVLRLNKNNLPHNPFINAGAIMACALIRPDLEPADRFDFVMNTWQELAGGMKPGFNNAIYLSERNSADRNYAIAHFMQEKKAFPTHVNLTELLEFYFQCCSIEITPLHMSIIAASLANSGICPLTQKQIFHPNTVKNCLSLMYSCGLYDFSGEFAFTVGLPAKSGVSGGIMLIVPNVLGICIYSPLIDNFGNSVRGVAFCKELVRRFNFHVYDSLVRTNDKQDPCRRRGEAKLSEVLLLISAASRGDLTEIKRLIATGVDLNAADYDGRTALHLAASEGQLYVVSDLLQRGVNVNPVDRWGGTPLADARRGKHQTVINLLQQHNALE